MFSDPPATYPWEREEIGVVEFRVAAIRELTRKLDRCLRVADINKLRDEVYRMDVEGEVRAAIYREVRDEIERRVRSTVYASALADELARLEVEYQEARKAGNGALQQTLMREKRAAIELEAERRKSGGGR